MEWNDSLFLQDACPLRDVAHQPESGIPSSLFNMKWTLKCFYIGSPRQLLPASALAKPDLYSGVRLSIALPSL